MSNKEALEQEGSDVNLVLKELSSLYPTLTTKLKKSADFVLENPIEVALLSIRKSAVAAEVTPSTLTRLAKLLGFERYDSFRQVFKEAMHNKAPTTFGKKAQSLQEHASSAPENAVFSDFINTTFENLEHFFQNDTQEKLQQAAPLIINAKKVYALGFRDTFACAHHFAYVGKIAFPKITLIRGYQGTLLSELAEIGEEDVVLVFGFDPYAIEMVNALKAIKGSNAKVIAITDNLRSPLASESDIAFTLENTTPHFFPSIIPAIALVEALVAACTALGGDTMVQNINQFEENLRRLGGYYEAP